MKKTYFYLIVLLPIFLFSQTTDTLWSVTQLDTKRDGNQQEFIKIQVNGSTVESGRTWYDYANNKVNGRMMAHACGTGDDGIHFVFMKRQPDASGFASSIYLCCLKTTDFQISRKMILLR